MDNKISRDYMREGKIPITIGTDPEFCLLDCSGKVLKASHYALFSSTHPSASIGCDGALVPVEIRPRPVQLTHIKVMTDEIALILQKIHNFCVDKHFSLVGGAVGGFRKRNITLGAHIHFGSPEFQLQKQDNGHVPTIKIPRVIVNDNINTIIKCMDTYFTPVINFFIDNDEIKQRLGGSYGTLGEYRPQPWGIEYRTPYCFLLNPLMIEGLFALAALIGYNYKQLSPDKNLYRKVAQYYDNVESSGKGLKIQRNIFKTIKPILLKMMSYNSPNPIFDGKIVSLFNLIIQGKHCTERNVLAAYNFKTKNNLPFHIEFQRTGYISELQQRISHKIKNNSNGEIYIYEADNGYSSNRLNQIYISRGLPKYKGLGVGNVFYNQPPYRKHNYSIGLSRGFLEQMLYGHNNHYQDYLVSYLNSLNLRKYNKIGKQ